MAKSPRNLYWAWASNKEGASTNVIDPRDLQTSAAKVATIARNGFGPGWTIHVMQRRIDGDGQSVAGEDTEIKSFTIRK